MVRLADMPEGTDEVQIGSGYPGRLYLWLPVGLALKKVRRYLRRLNSSFLTTTTGALSVDAPKGYPEELLQDLVELLTEDEASDTRCVFKTGVDDLDGDDIRRVRTIGQVRELRESSWLVDMLRANRLTSVFQPIVRADEPSNVLGHEALVRGIGYDGRTISPDSLFGAARGCGLLPELDCAARRSAIRAVAKKDDHRQLFLNFTADSVSEGMHTLAPTIAEIDSAEILRDRVIFEVIEAERTPDLRQLRTVVDCVRGAGFRVALDNVGCYQSSRRLLEEVLPDFVKLDMKRVRATRCSHLGDAESLMDLAQRLKVETIAEGVETRAELAWNRERGATYVQGYFIARPAALER